MIYSHYSPCPFGALMGTLSGAQSRAQSAFPQVPSLTCAGVEFIPFSLEASGVWGPAARRFFAKCLYLADDDRDIDVYHWSSAKFSSTWHDTISILLARGRAQVSVAASRGDWPKRTQDQAYSDQNHASAA